MTSIRVGEQTYEVATDPAEARARVQRALEGLVVSFDLVGGGTLFLGAAAGAVTVHESPPA